MKSFFKKLAFVMALAMVVSLAAPAAAKADTVASLAEQYTGTVYEEVDLTLEEVIDFTFVNPPEDWNASGVKKAWVSSNPEVATVNNYGKVFPVALGTTEISWTLDGVAVATCTVNVIEEVEVEEPVATPTNTAAPTPTNTTAPSPTPTEAPLSFEVVQVSDSKLEVRFNKASTYSKNDVNFLITYDNPYGEKPIEFKWNLKDKAYNADNTVLTLTANGLFKDGATYAVKTSDGVLEDVVEIEIGRVTDVALVPRKDAETGEEIFFVNPKIDEDTAINYDLYFDIKLYSGEIDVTDTYWEYIDADFLLEAAQVPAETEIEDVVTIDETQIAAKREIKVNFETENTIAYVTPNFIIDLGLEDEEPYTVGGPKVIMGAGAHTPWNMIGVSDWAIVSSTHDPKKPVDWEKKYITADDTDGTTQYFIVLKILDVNLQTYVTYEKATEDGANLYIGAEGVEYFEDRYALEFMASETSKNDIIVKEDGEIKVYKKTTATFVVELTDLDTDEQDPEVIWAGDIEVKKGKELDSIDVKDATMTVLTETNMGTGTNVAKAEITAMSQYDRVALPLNGSDFTYTVTSKTNGVTITEAHVTVVEEGGKVYVKAFGDQLKNLSVSELDVEVTATEKDTNNKASDMVKIVIVKTKDASGNFLYQQSPKKTNYAYVDVALVEADAVDVKGSVIPADGVMTGTAKVYYAAKGTETKVDLYDLEDVNEIKNAAGEVVGTYDAVIAENSDYQSAITNEGTVFVIVRDPSGNIISEGVTIVENTVVVDLTSKTNENELKITATGSYTVQVGVVRYYKQKTDRSRSDYLSKAVELKVNNKLDDVSLKGTKANATYDYAGDFANFAKDAEAIKALIVATIAFNKGSDEWTGLTTNEIHDYKIVCLDNVVIVKSVTFHVPAANGIYYVDEVRNIDKAITLE